MVDRAGTGGAEMISTSTKKRPELVELEALEVPARFVPVPDSISADLQRFIAGREGDLLEPAPQSTDDWLRAIEVANKVGAARARALWKKLDLHVTSITVGSTRCFRLTPGAL